VIKRSVIAIDGPAASGKSSTAQMVANRLGFLHVDSGSLYRAATAATLRLTPDPSRWTEAMVVGAAESVSLVPARTSFYRSISGQSIEDEIRGESVTQNVSAVAKMRTVREWVNRCVRKAAEGKDVVVDGRDMGTAVFPDAEVKVFLTADPRERARRRILQRGGKLTAEGLDAETSAINERDARDATQTKPAEDAVVIDTTDLGQAEQVARIVALARARL